MKLIFARHGESQANLLHEISNRGLKHGLTPKGRAQAEALAKHLAGQEITRIYSSPLLRALETAILVARQLGLDYTVADALREYDCGAAEDRSDAEAWQLWQSLFDDWTIHGHFERRIPGGESFQDLQQRFVPFIDGLARQYGEAAETILCISHGGLYWMMLPQILANVDTALIQERGGFGYATCVMAEWTGQQLLCTDWYNRADER